MHGCKDDQTKPTDKVLDQDPAGGQGCRGEGHQGTLDREPGPARHPMPNLVGQPLPQAAAAAAGQGLQVDVDGDDVDQQFGTVQAQNPSRRTRRSRPGSTGPDPTARAC